MPPNAPDSNPINLFVCEISTTSKLGFGVLIDWSKSSGIDQNIVDSPYEVEIEVDLSTLAAF